MAAPTTTDVIRTDSFQTFSSVHTALFGSSQETAATKVDLSSLAFVDPNNGTQTCSVDELRWNIQGTGQVTVLLGTGLPVTVAQLSGFGHIEGGALSAAGGDINFTTTGMSSGTTYQIEIKGRKAGGFVQNPVVQTLTFDSLSAGPNFNVGDTITSTVAFSGPVLVTGAPTLPLNFTSGTVQATCTNASNAYATTLSFVYVVTASDQSQAGTMTTGTTLNLNGGRLSGGLGDGNASITFSAASTSTVTINKKATLSVTLVAGTGPRYDTGETITFTVTGSKALTVTGTPTIPITITSGNKNASYVSGSGTTALTFSYSPVVSGDSSASGTVSISSPVVLNGGTIKDSLGNAAVLTFTPPSLSSVSFNHS